MESCYTKRKSVGFPVDLWSEVGLGHGLGGH